MNPAPDEGLAMGRPPKGLDHIDSLPGEPLSKHRLRVILETLTGQRSVAEACEELSLSEARFHTLRKDVLAGALDALDPKPLGRPPNPVDRLDAGRVAELERIVRDLQFDLETERVRAEIALVLPQAQTRAQ